MSEAWNLGIQFFSQLITGQVPMTLIILLIGAMLLDLVVQLIHERFYLPDKNIVIAFLSLCIEKVIEGLVFIYFFIALSKLSTALPFVEITDTSALALGEMATVSYIIYNALTIPGVLIHYGDSTVSIAFNFIGQFVVGGLLYYVLFALLPMTSPFNLPLLGICLVVLIILNIVLWKTGIQMMQEKQHQSTVD